jgi:hypothetical protein
MQTIEIARPYLYPLQEAAIFATERYSVISASTKSGKTFGCLAWLLELTVQAPAGRNFWWVAPIYPQAKIAYRRIARQLAQKLPRDAYTCNESELTIAFSGHGMMWFKGADNPDSLYGEDVYAAVIDEATRVKEDAWHAVRSTLTATRGPIRIIGNVKGRKNWAYKLARRAEAGEPNMKYSRITALDAVEAGVLDEDEIEDARRALPEQVFRELYMAEPSDDGGNPFGIVAIGDCIAPLSTQPAKVWAWDLAKSVDWVVGIALDAQHHVCGFERWQGPWEPTIDRIIAVTGTCPAIVDSTGVGDPVLEALQKRAPVRPGPHAPKPRYEGFKFTAASKQQIMEGLAVAIQQGEITYPDGPIVAELEAFEFEFNRTGGVRYSAPSGMHDDCVSALALALHGAGSKRAILPGISRAAAGAPRPILETYDRMKIDRDPNRIY